MPPKTPVSRAKGNALMSASDSARANIRTEGRTALVLDAATLGAAIAALRASGDAMIEHMLGVAGPPAVRSRPAGFAGLASIIMAQQLSVASASAIFARLEARLAPLDAAAVLGADDIVLRECGLSGPKIRTLRAIAAAVTTGALTLDALPGMEAEAARAMLTSVKGIGPWTASVYLLFCIGHADSFPAGDLALQEAAKIALGLEVRPHEAALSAIAEAWRPHRGVAALLLWRYYGVVKQGRAGIALAGD